MAIRKILQEGDPGLEKISREVSVFDERLHTLLDDMLETMDLSNGVGLAAPQVGVLRRAILVLDIEAELEDEEDEPPLFELINPTIIAQEGEVTQYEGCLSVPGMVGEVSRPEFVRVRGQDRFGNPIEVEGTGITARALCHEIDHLDGKLYTRLCDKLVDAESIAEA